MILESVIENVIGQQKSRLKVRGDWMKREITLPETSLSSHAIIISGVRRCGKSTLLMQIMTEHKDKSVVYLNFESPHLYDFTIADFSRLDNIITRKKATMLFFDEIQVVAGWEIYVRQKLDEGYQVIVTGSNASLLSNELGTKLTGRHITKELFPFSYREFLAFKDQKPSVESLKTYLNSGGFPEFIKTGDEDQLTSLFNDILYRDIVTRFGIKDIRSLQRLAVYLISNIGNRITATKLKQPLSIGATSTILIWFSHLELSYLMFFLPMFSHSTKAQLINPRKVYVMDPGFIDLISNTYSDDSGRKFENLIFLFLRRKYNELYYFDDKGECDFIAFKNGKVDCLVQVCYQLTPDNIKRELDGLLKAMRFFNRQKAVIVTFDDSDFIKEEGYEIDVVPAWQYMSSEH